MKILGIDYGKKWIGIAISDDNRKLAFPYKTLENNRRFFLILNEIIKKEEIYKIVIGLPLNKEMRPTKQTEEVENWAEKLAWQINVPTEFYNEIFTTKEAVKAGAKNQHSAAAVLILQSYLDRKNVKE